MKRLFRNYYPILIIAAILYSCVEEPIEIEKTLQTGKTIPANNSVIATRTVNASEFIRQANPYGISNMQKVYDDYEVDITLEPTDLYVKFMPTDSSQLRTLHESGLELFDYPLDIELNAGDIYVNDSIPEGTLTWVYTTVKPEYTFPTDIPYEILEECYIPEDGETIEVPLRGGSSYIVDVEAKAFENLGYDIDTTITRAAKVEPSGQILVYDNTSNQLVTNVPVKGVKIRCHRFVRWGTGYTDTLGNYKINNAFRYRPHYAIVFENKKGFSIWGNYGPIARANHNMGWDSNTGHSEVIRETSDA